MSHLDKYDSEEIILNHACDVLLEIQRQLAQIEAILKNIETILAKGKK